MIFLTCSYCVARDLKLGGTWFGIRKDTARVAFLTNIRVFPLVTNKKSRGVTK